MSDEANRSMTMAYELIESEKLDEARSVLEPLLADNKDDPNVWWLSVHAAEDPAAAHKALQNVLRLDPEYPGAAELRQEMKKVSGESLDDDRPRSIRKRLMPWLVALFVVMSIVVVLLLTSPGSEDDLDNQQTVAAQIVGTNTPVPLASSLPVATQPDVTEPADQQVEFQEILVSLAGFDLHGERIETVETDMGTTLLASICTNADVPLRDTLNGAMLAIADESATIAMDVDFFGVSLVDCDSGDVINVIAVSLASATEYLNGTLDEDEFRRRWMPTRVQ